MVEWGVGVSTPWTWQNAGTSAEPRPPRPPGGVNGPAATALLELIVVSASLRPASASHSGPDPGGATTGTGADAVAARTTVGNSAASVWRNKRLIGSLQSNESAAIVVGASTDQRFNSPRRQRWEQGRPEEA